MDIKKVFRPANLRRIKRTDDIKFIVGNRADYSRAKRLITKYRLAKACSHLLFSPVSGKLAPEILAGWLLHDGLNARLHLQLHKILRLK